MRETLRCELGLFYLFVGECLSKKVDLTPEAALDLWRVVNPTPEQLADSVDAVRESFAEIAEGEVGMPLDEFLQQFRKQHGLP